MAPIMPSIPAWFEPPLFETFWQLDTFMRDQGLSPVAQLAYNLTAAVSAAATFSRRANALSCELL